MICLPLFKGAFHLPVKPIAEYGLISLSALPRISTSSTFGRGLLLPVFQLNKLIDSVFSPLIRHHRRRRASQKQYAAVMHQTLQCNIHGLVFRRHVRLICGFVLLVHNHKAQIFHRRKHTDPGADHDLRFASPYALSTHQIALAWSACCAKLRCDLYQNGR